MKMAKKEMFMNADYSDYLGSEKNGKRKRIYLDEFQKSEIKDSLAGSLFFTGVGSPLLYAAHTLSYEPIKFVGYMLGGPFTVAGLIGLGLTAYGVYKYSKENRKYYEDNL